MKFTVLIPTYNRSCYLLEALNSVLSQDYQDLEIIVVDNASSDNTEEIINLHALRDNFRYIRNQVNLGMVGSWRKALYELINGEYFLILSDDDYLTNKSFISTVVEKITKNGVNYCISKGLVKYEPEGRLEEIGLGYKNLIPIKELFFDRFRNKSKFPYALCGVAFNTEFARKYGAFNNEFNLNCDSELLLASSLSHKGIYIDGLNFVYRIHDSNLIHKIDNDPKLFICGLEFYTSPLLYALSSGIFNKNEFNIYFYDFIKPLMRRHYFKTIIFFPDYIDFYQNFYSDFLAEVEVFDINSSIEIKFIKTLPGKAFLFLARKLHLIR